MIPCVSFRSWRLHWCSASACRLLLGVYVTLYDTVGKLTGLVARPLVFLSCVIHSLRDLPATGRKYILLNPITHLVDTARTSIFDIQPLPEVNLYLPDDVGG